MMMINMWIGSGIIMKIIIKEKRREKGYIVSDLHVQKYKKDERKDR